uniref:Uncharacterized protein n=1 Tax=Triticum urartu TaxID=4572 RepID=A0A8R7UWN2_TRIUA
SSTFSHPLLQASSPVEIGTHRFVSLVHATGGGSGPAIIPSARPVCLPRRIRAGNCRPSAARLRPHMQLGFVL